MTAFAPRSRAFSIIRSIACLRLSSSSSVYWVTSPWRSALNPAPIDLTAPMLRTTRPNATPKSRSTVMPSSPSAVVTGKPAGADGAGCVMPVIVGLRRAAAVDGALLPWPGSWPPGVNAAAVCLVLGAELAGQGWFLVPAGERGGGDPDGGGIAEQDGLAQQECLPGDGGHDRQVHRVADVPVEAADHQALGRSGRGGRAAAFDGEARERLDQDDASRDEHDQPGQAHRQPCGQRPAQPPAGQPPGDQ